MAEVDEEIIAEVLSTATGIPVFKLTEEESARLLRMEEELGKRYIGQHDAVRGEDLGAVGRQPRGRTQPLERVAHGPDVGATAVDQRDPQVHRTPLVEGTQSTRGSFSVAVRSARASALNCA